MAFRTSGVLETRYCMGYTHPNTYHIIMLQFILVLIWMFWDKMMWYHVLLAAIGNGLVFLATDSRTNLLLGTILLTLMLLVKINKKLQEKTWIYGLGFLVLGGSLILSLLSVTVGTKWSFMELLNKLWTNRIFHSWEADGRLTAFSSVDYQVSLDMGFVKLLYNYGIVIFIAVISIIIAKLLQMQSIKNL